MNESNKTVDEILLRLHFREMALRFLDGINPQPYKAIVIADAICSYDGSHIDANRPIRYQAHDFVQEALRVIQNETKGYEDNTFHQWIQLWNKKFG